MGKCQETGCNEKATHKYRAVARFRVPLCDRHYKEWEKYAEKRSPVTLLIGLGKGLVRLTGVLMLLVGVLAIGFALSAVTQGTKLSFEMDIGLIFTELHLHLEDALSVSLVGILVMLVGVALFYVGFMKMEHDLW